MSTFKYSGGAMVAIIVAVAAAAVLVLRWLGQNAAAISAGARAAGQVFIFLLIAGGIGAVAWQVQRHRRAAAAPPDPAPVHATSGQIPAEVPAVQPAAIESPRVYFTDDQFATLMRQQVTVTQLPRDSHDREPG